MAKRLRTILEQMTMADARKVFQKHGVTSTDHEELKGHYKRLMKKVHPDHGGNIKDAQELNAAWDKIKNNSGHAETQPVTRYDTEVSHIFGGANGYQKAEHTSSVKHMRADPVAPPSVKFQDAHDHLLRHGYKMGSSFDIKRPGYRAQEYTKAGGHYAWLVHKDGADRYKERIHNAVFGKR